VTSLAFVLTQSNIIEKTDVLYDFVNGFNTVDELATYVNVGRGKELTDSKINGTSHLNDTDAGLTKMYAAMPQCSNIILGASHDNGYARVLSTLETENVAPGKVVLLEGQAFAAELQRFSLSTFPRAKFENLFMEKKIDAGKKYAQVAADGVLPMTRKAPASPPKASPVVPKKLVEPDPCNFSLCIDNHRRSVVCQKSFAAGMQYVLSQRGQVRKI
jgi:hypothetical protein